MQAHESKEDLLESTNFKASDIFKLAGMTYRQIHDWENRAGIGESDRAAPEGWRKFDLSELLALCICSELRRQFSLPLSDIGNLYKWFLGKKTDKVNETLAMIGELNIDSMRQNPKISKLLSLQGQDLIEALKDEVNRYVVSEYCRYQINRMSTEPVKQAWKLASLGLVVYLYTDLKSTLILPENNLVQVITTRLPKQPTIIFPLNPIFNLLRDRLSLPPFPLDKYDSAFLGKWNQLNKEARLSKEERKVLDLIRSKKYQRIVVHLEGGEVIRATADEDLPLEDRQKLEKSIQEAISDHRYQTISISVQDGKPVRLKRDVSMHLKR